MVTQVHKGRCITEYAAIYGQPPPIRLASCPQVAQFDMSGQDLSLSQLSVDYWGAGDMTHTQSFITPAVNTEAHRTKYASEIIKRGTDTEL